MIADHQIQFQELSPRKVMGHSVDSVTLLGRSNKQISAEHKKRLKLTLNE